LWLAQVDRMACIDCERVFRASKTNPPCETCRPVFVHTYNLEGLEVYEMCADQFSHYPTGFKAGIPNQNIESAMRMLAKPKDRWPLIFSIVKRVSTQIAYLQNKKAIEDRNK
jgi:hypothetical protein